MSRITFGLRLVSPFKPYSRVAEDSVFCFLRVAAVVVVVAVCSCLSSYSSLRSRNESHVWFKVGFRPQTPGPGLLKTRSSQLLPGHPRLRLVPETRFLLSKRGKSFPWIGLKQKPEFLGCVPWSRRCGRVSPASRMPGIGRLCTSFGRRTRVGMPGFGIQPYHSPPSLRSSSLLRG